MLVHTLTHLAAANVPNPGPQAPPGVGTVANTFLGWLKWAGLIAGVAGLCFAGIKMSAGNRNRSSIAADGAAHIPWALAGVSVCFLAAGLVSIVAT